MTAAKTALYHLICRLGTEHCVSVDVDSAPVEQAGDLTHGKQQHFLLVCSRPADHFWSHVSYPQVQSPPLFATKSTYT